MQRNKSYQQRTLKMKYFTLLLILPCVLAAEIKNTVCTDNTQCPEGKYCCELPNGQYGCCDLAKDVEDKILVPGLPISTSANVSMPDPQAMNAPCSGTQCGNYCIPGFKWGNCCATPNTACPLGSKCCGSYGRQWCCPSRSSCAYTYKMCRNSAVTTSTAMLTILLTAMMGIFSKYIL